MTFYEKNAWICVVSLSLVYLPYFVISWLQPESSFPLFFVAVLILIGVMAAFHTVNSICSRRIRKTGDPLPMDERDINIEIKSAKIAGIVLSVIVTLWSVNAIIGIAFLIFHSMPVEQEPMKNLATVKIPVMPVLLAVEILFAGFVLANLIYYTAIIFGYRRYS